MEDQYAQWRSVPASKWLSMFDDTRDKSGLQFGGILPRGDMSQKEIIDWNMDLYKKLINEPITEPKVDDLKRAGDTGRANATLLVLVRNRELNKVADTVNQIEKHFNSKFNYPYVFLNNNLFSPRFESLMRQVLPERELYFETIDGEIWNKPKGLSSLRLKLGQEFLVEEGIGYASKESYHNMCRYYSGHFYNHPRLQKFKWYWRFEPGTNYYCDIDYDVFQFMEDHNKTYGFTISVYDAHQSVKSLWTTTMDYVKLHPDSVHPNAATDFLTENLMHPEKTLFTKGYSTCHFWSNFEIGNMDFFRLDPYNSWFEYLEKTGGFYYERWGDAPVHSIGLSLFEDKSKLHWFRDMGYEHTPYVNCPNSPKCLTRPKGSRRRKEETHCELGEFTFKHLYDQNCMPNWIRYEMNDESLELY